MLLFWNTWDPREDTRRVRVWCRATGSRTTVIRQEASEQRCDNFKQDLKTSAHVRVTGASVTAHQTIFPPLDDLFYVVAMVNYEQRRWEVGVQQQQPFIIWGYRVNFDLPLPIFYS